ncbi:MAG: hypothetical protein ACNA7V_08870, partial [Bacteroidales bacterium]
MGLLKPLSFMLFCAFLLCSTIPSLAQSDQGTDYASIIKQADSYYASGDFIKAKTSYEYALRIRPNEAYPKTQLDKVLKKLRDQMMVMEEYSAIIGQADQLFWSRDYDQAELRYMEAAKMVPAEGYPKQKIKEIEGIRAEERKIQVAFDDAIYRAERFEKYKKYDEAIAQYEKALELAPGDQTLPEKIAMLHVTKVQYEQTKQDYDLIIANADRLYSLKFYESARDEYQRAADARPEEEYPAKQLALIGPLLDEMKAFDQLVEKGDELYMVQDFAGAMKNYEAALQISPEESYPQTMMERVKEALANPQQKTVLNKDEKIPEAIDEMASAASKDDEYDKILASANQLFGLQDYEEAKLAYLKAS